MIDPDTNTLPRQIRKHRRRRRWIWIKRIAFVLALHFAIATLGFAINWKLTRDAGEKQLAVHTARLDAEDPGWRFVDIVAEHNSKVPTPETNTAMKAVEIVRQFPSAPDYSLLRADIDKGRLPNELPDADDWKRLDSHFPEWEPGVVELRKFNASTPRGRIAIAYPGGNPINIKLDHTQHIRTAAFALAWDALRSSHAGRPDPALGSAVSGLHLIRSIDFEPTLITYLIRLGSAQTALQSVEQTLAWCRNPGEKSLIEVQELVARESEHAFMHTAQRGDRALMLHMFDLIDRGEIGLESAKPDWSLGTIVYKQHMPTNSVYILERHAEFATMLELPPAEESGSHSQLDDAAAHPGKSDGVPDDARDQ